MSDLSKERELIDSLKAKYGNNLVSQSIPRAERITITVENVNLKEIATFIKEEMKFNRLLSISGVDYPKENVIELVYHISSVELNKNFVLSLKTRIDRNTPKIESLVDVWRSAEYLERETFEMLGVHFNGHPNLQRLFLPEDWVEPPPLRKDSKLTKVEKFVPTDS